MSKRKKSGLPRIELILMSTMIMVLVGWSVNSCSKARLRNAQNKQRQLELADSLAKVEKKEMNILDSIRMAQARNVSLANPVKNSLSTTLFVTIDGLNMRETPDLKSEVIVQLALFDEVIYLEEVTDFTTVLNLGKEEVDEPWFKVRSKKGHEGWVYGAGVDFYKYKHPGVR